MISKMFWLFLKISALTIGGGYAMVPVIEKNLEKKGWVKSEDFYNMLTLAQSLPGPIAFNISWMIGKRLAGLPGAFAASTAVLLPPFFAIVAASSIISGYRENPYVAGFLRGAYGALIGMIGGLVFKMYKNQNWNLFKIILISASVLVVFLKADFMIPLFIFLVMVNYLKEMGRGGKRC